MNPSKKQNTSNWFYIKHLATNRVISAGKSCDTVKPDEYVRSKVLVTKQNYTDNELWCWDDHYLKNKFTGLVLDIRKGKLRFIEDTEICLFYKKSYEVSQNQMWASRPAAETESNIMSEHPLFKRRSSCQTPPGNVIYSVRNDDWVLDVCCPEEHTLCCEKKLVLFPQDQVNSNSQRWEFIPENFAQHNDNFPNKEHESIFDNSMSVSSPLTESSSGYSSGSSSISLDSVGFANGLSPAKRFSQSSLHSLNKKLTLEENYIYQTPQTHPIYS